MSKSICPFKTEDYDIRASYTRLGKFRGCPALGSLAYRHIITGDDSDRITIEASDQMTRGRLVHEALGKYATHCITTGKTSDPDAMAECYRQALMEHKPQQSVLDGSPSPEEIIQQFTASHEFPKLEKGEEWGVERSLWTILKSPAGVRIALEAKVDLFRVVGDRAWVNDYKTGFRIMDSDDFKHKEIQLPLYFLVIMANYPKVQHGTGTLDWVARDYQQEKTISAESIQRALDFVFLTAEMIADGIKRVKVGESVVEVFPAHPGRACEPFDGVACEAIGRCPYHGHTDNLVIDSADKARALMGEYMVVGARQKAIKSALVAHAAENGPIECNGKVLTFELTDKVKVESRDALVTWMVEQGKIGDLQPVASSMVSKGTATDLAKECRDEGLLNITRDCSEKFRNS